MNIKIHALMTVAMLAGMFTLSTLAANANPGYYHRVNARQCKQQTRINSGVSNGQLNRREARRLQARQVQLAMSERRMRISGKGLTPQERARLENRQDNLSQSIYQQKHDPQVRP